ncbi:MAG: cytochrome-c peroxidase [Gammaproteobacteria bacterium]|nr:cytochrome-c peroxidase [Gammaproteobacteria bacterium]
MKRITFISALLVIAVIYIGFSINQGDPVSVTNNQLESSLVSSYQSYDSAQLQPLPVETSFNPLKVSLGERLFHEKALSSDGSISCASCHDIKTNGAEKTRFSTGINGAKGKLNSPTVFNSAFNFKQFWDGRVNTLEEQVAGPIHNPIEMGSNWKEVVDRLKDNAVYRVSFAAVYPKNGITAETIADAIATFERTLITPDSKFDQFIKGKKDALSTDELAGFQLFKDYGCVSCHQGVNIGGNMLQKIGIFKPFIQGQSGNREDLGHYNVTNLEKDKYVFKVPSLRNVAVTAPYFHNGSVDDLSEVVSIMGHYQLGRELSDSDIQLLVSFLKTLTGEWQGRRLK